MVYRIFVEKKKELAFEAKSLLSDINSLLLIDSVKDLRILNRYDVENIEAAVNYIDEIFEYQGNEKQAEAMSRAKKQYDFEEIMVRMKIIYREVADNV